MSVVNGVHKKNVDVAIVGAGLVGSLEACLLAKRGFNVHLYEYREDIRKTPTVRGKSINLAMSVRGRLALREIGLEDHIIKKHGIPMKARMIHNLDGSTYAVPYDPKNGQCIYSVGRNYLNGLLLTESEKYKNVQRSFNHKLADLNLESGSLTFTKTDTGETVKREAEVVIGADGAFSAVRKHFMKQPLFNFSQTYIEHGYLELCIPADENGQFQMPPNYLHIWPRGSLMMIALPNQDCSWTVTLFMPFTQFDKLNSEETLIEFFETNFPDSIPLMGKKNLILNFFAEKAQPLVAIKCRPYHINNNLLIGDAAHAVVPFYGQGMNAGFEDCYILNKLLQKYDDDISRVFSEFSETRWKDAHAISDLAMYNYIEMRDLVTRPSFLIRKKFDNILYSVLPSFWLPLYQSVTFTTTPYSACIANKEWQDKIVSNLLVLLKLVPVACLFGLLLMYYLN